jgi:hypothetical protein
MYDDPKSKINQLEKILDAREDRVTKKIKRHELHDRESNVPQDWDNSEFGTPAVGLEVNSATGFSGTKMNVSVDEKSGTSLPMKILIGSVIFFVLALVLVLFKFLGGVNVVSGDNIEVTVKAPTSMAGGELLPLEIEIKNNNSVALLGADLGINFPAGAMQENNVAIPAKRQQEFLGDVAPGQSIVKNLKVIMFGSENEKKTINLTLEYRVKGSNSLFNKTKNIVVVITSAPVTLVIKGPSEVNTSQNVNFSVEITSNSSSIIKNLLLKAEYPFGFTFSNSNPTTFSKNNLWLIGDLAPGEKRTVSFSGIVTGQEGEERGFNFSLGTQSSSDTALIETPFTSSFSSVTIRRPFVSADITINGKDTAEYVATAGSKLETVINWQNNLPYQVSDVSIAVKINGNALDKSSIVAAGGFYRSIDNTIIFDKTTDKTFLSLDPGQIGESKFTLNSFSTLSVTGSGLSNPIISLAITVQGKTIDSSGHTQNVLFSDSRKIKLTSNPRLVAKSLYYVGPFKNTGPIPPKAEKETTYTVVWTVTNPLNNLSGATVVATLPPYIKWLDTVSSSAEKMSYDPNTSRITWSIGNVSAGAGSISPAKEVSFQLSMLPSVSQIGEAPDLLSDSVLTARDAFTSTIVSSLFPAVSTKFSNDPYFKFETENVVK